ncbi:hypothetical protein NE237_007826 [Protea cynaroides]|uniref:LOB domain-containing protein n=1 Tax=Protea cynaroides TaxID=273540 RepID=A0A9Q0QWR8_9MAGN|nr:hypothetical protein NE237_007826 [Protea cynaroides]
MIISGHASTTISTIKIHPLWPTLTRILKSSSISISNLKKNQVTVLDRAQTREKGATLFFSDQEALSQTVKMASSSSPCAACKFLRRKCMSGCVFAPYFPPEEPQKFANVHKIFGASNVTKLLNELPPHQREDAVSSLAYEAEARIKDPVYGCVGVISVLQRRVQKLQKELDDANADLIRYACNEIPGVLPTQRRSLDFGRRMGDGGSSFYQASDLSLPYPPPPPPWPDNKDGSS